MSFLSEGEQAGSPAPEAAEPASTQTTSVVAREGRTWLRAFAAFPGIGVPSPLSALRGDSKPLDRLLRWPLGLIYVWFGVLKLVGMSTVVELVRSAYPGIATAPLVEAAP